MSSQRFQQKLAQQRVRDDTRDALVASVTLDKTLKENFKSDDRAGTQRVIREQREAYKEQYTAAQMQAAHESQQRTQRLRAQDEKLAAELVKRKTESIREQKNIQRIVEQSEELRYLEEKLKQAYMNKERDAQVLESAALLKKERVADAEIAGLVEQERQRGLQAEAYRDYLRQKEGRTIMVALDAQVAEKMEMKKLAEEQFVKEKAEVDAVVAAIEAEDAREAEAREIKEAQIRAHIAEFVQEKEMCAAAPRPLPRLPPSLLPLLPHSPPVPRTPISAPRSPLPVSTRAPRISPSSPRLRASSVAILSAPRPPLLPTSHPAPSSTPPYLPQQRSFKNQHAERVEAEKAEIRAYAEEVMRRETVFRMAREKDQNTKDEIFARLSADMAKRQLEADEMENLRNELIIQETEERVIQKEKEKAERAEQNKKDIALANEYQRQLKAIKREEEKAEEDVFKRAMMEKFAEDDRLDQMNEHKRRMKQLEHRREIERLLELRREKFEEERQAQTQEQLDQDAADAMRGKIIDDERRRILEAHSKNLDLKHLPKGVLASDADFAIFNKESIFAGHSGL